MINRRNGNNGFDDIYSEVSGLEEPESIELVDSDGEFFDMENITAKRFEASLRKTSKKDLIPGGYVRIPRVIQRMTEISQTSKAVYAMLLGCARKEGGFLVFPSQETIAWNIGAARSTVQNSLNQLKEFKLISWEIRDKRSNNYDLFDTPDWIIEKYAIDRTKENDNHKPKLDASNKFVVDKYFGEAKPNKQYRKY